MILPGNEINTLPKIIYDEMAGIVKIEGRSISSDAQIYFNDFLPYFEDCLKRKPMDLILNLDLEYFNTTTSKLLMDFFNIAKSVEKEGFTVKVNWYFEEDDEDMEDAGGDYESLTKLDFNIIQKPE
jgi:hypothetical protein